MKKMMQLMLTICLSQGFAFAGTNGISLTLYFPYTEMLMEEWYDFSITLSNGSSHAVQIIKNPHSVVERQLIFDLGTTGTYPLHTGWDRFNDSPNKWKPVGKSPETTLPAGESYTWDIRFGYYRELTGVIRDCGLTSMTVRCVLDTNKWVQSNTVQMKFHPDEILSSVFDEDTTPQYEKMYKAKLGDKTYLFDHFKMRICELPEDDMPNIQRNPVEKNISISFPKSNRKILYDPEKAGDLIYRKIKPVE